MAPWQGCSCRISTRKRKDRAELPGLAPHVAHTNHARLLDVRQRQASYSFTIEGQLREETMIDKGATHGPVCRCGGANSIVTLSRRRLLTGTAALGGMAAGGISMSWPSLAQAKPHRIDVHHHVSPPTWLDAVKKAKLDNPPMVNWSPRKSLDDMDQGGIATAIVSPTTPQVNFLDHDKDAAARIARESNEYTKKLISDRPGRFGLFAMLPLPHIDASLEE